MRTVMCVMSDGPNPSREVAFEKREGVSDVELLRRFVVGRDEGAFGELLNRHGPMVLGVCRRVLRNREDAEDAFQATFLVLAMKAGKIREPELLGNWLFGAATRAALMAKRGISRRAAQEKRLMRLF